MFQRRQSLRETKFQDNRWDQNLIYKPIQRNLFAASVSQPSSEKEFKNIIKRHTVPVLVVMAKNNKQIDIIKKMILPQKSPVVFVNATKLQTVAKDLGGEVPLACLIFRERILEYFEGPLSKLRFFANGFQQRNIRGVYYSN